MGGARPSGREKREERPATEEPTEIGVGLHPAPFVPVRALRGGSRVTYFKAKEKKIQKGNWVSKVTGHGGHRNIS